MTYKETVYFVAKCLTISLEHKNRDEIEKQLQSNNIDENVPKYFNEINKENDHHVDHLKSSSVFSSYLNTT